MVNDNNIESAWIHRIVPGLKELDKKADHEKKGLIGRYMTRLMSLFYQEGTSNKSLFHPLYATSVQQYKDIQPHAEADYFPSQLFEKLSPHGREDEFNWLRDNYEPFSLPVYLDFINTVKRGVNPKNYSITFDKPPRQYESSSLDDYLLKDYPTYNSIQTWFSNSFFDFKIKDANGFVSVRPLPSMWDQVKNEDGSVEFVITDELIEPIAHLHHSSDVVYYEEDEHLIVISSEKSTVKQGDKNVPGWVLYHYDRDTIYRYYQVGEKKDYEFEVFEYFNHNWGYLPAWSVKGVPRIVKDQVYYQSPFYFSIGHLNTYIKNKMTLEIATVNSAYPYRIMVADECDYVNPSTQEKCFNGMVSSSDGYVKCPQCQGTGLKDKPSAGGTMLVNEAEVEGSASLDRIRFVAPDTAILEYLKKKCQEEKDGAREVLHLRTTTDVASGGDDTATGRLIDHESMYSFIRPIVDEGYDVFEGVIDAITYMRYGKEYSAPKVIRPTDMFEKTSAELLDQYINAVKNGMPPIVIKRFMDQYIKSLFYKSETEKKIWKLAMSVDTIAPLSNEEVRSLKGANVVSNWQVVLHYSIFSIIEDLMAEDEEFLNKSLDEQKQAVKDKAKMIASEAVASGNRAQLVDTIVEGG